MGICRWLSPVQTATLDSDPGDHQPSSLGTSPPSHAMFRTELTIFHHQPWPPSLLCLREQQQHPTHLAAPRATWEASCLSYLPHPRQVIRHSLNSQLRVSPWLDSTRTPLSPLLGQASMLARSSAQSLSCVWLFVTPWIAARQASLSITNSWRLLKLMSIESVMPSNHLLLQPSIFPSIRVFSNESVLGIRWPKYWSFSFSISLSNEHPGLISFRMDWLDLLAVQGTLKSLLQHHTSKVSILQCPAFFMVQLSHPYMTTGKIIALTRWTFVSKSKELCLKNKRHYLKQIKVGP